MNCSICGARAALGPRDMAGNRYCSDECFRAGLSACPVCSTLMPEWRIDTDGTEYCSEECMRSTWPTCNACGKNSSVWHDGQEGARYCSEKCLQTSWPNCDVCGFPMDQQTELASGHHVCSDECAEAVEKHALSQKWAHGYGNVLAAKEYAAQTRFRAQQGHGFAAERANHIVDVLTFKKAKLVGEDNAKNGADRIVDGVEIQTKYWDDGKKCIKDCFSKKDGKFKYLRDDGSPMKIEVPSDKYEAAVKEMEKRIRNGEIPGVSDPKDATKIVKKGAFTYKQAVQIAKAGTVESLVFDGVMGVQVAGTTAGLSAVLTYACAIWRGDSQKDALKHAWRSGVSTFGPAWVISVASSQIGKSGIGREATKLSYKVVSKMSKKTITFLFKGAGKETGKKVSEQAAKRYVANMISGNIVAGAVSTVVLSAADVHRMVTGRISLGQAFKNVTTTGASTAAGMVSWPVGAAYGAQIGTAVFPGPGTAAGAILGGMAASIGSSMAVSAATKGAIGIFIKDDAQVMLRIFHLMVEELALEFVLNEGELGEVLEQVKGLGLDGVLGEMYKTSDRQRYAARIVRPIIMKVVEARPTVTPPDEEQFLSVADL